MNKINISIVGCGYVSYYYYVSMNNYNNIKLIVFMIEIKNNNKLNKEEAHLLTNT